jgi:hypothetical protein
MISVRATGVGVVERCSDVRVVVVCTGKKENEGEVDLGAECRGDGHVTGRRRISRVQFRTL